MGLFVLASLALGAVHLHHLQVVLLLFTVVAVLFLHAAHKELLRVIMILQMDLLLALVLIAEEPLLDSDGHLHSHEDKQVEGDDEGAGDARSPRRGILPSSLLNQVVNDQKHHYKQLQHLIEGQAAELFV